jgi:lipoprotein-releasing system ATP-binding protein
MNEPVIRCKQIDKKYDDGVLKTDVLNRINLTANPGQSIAIVGASGSGKSTLLHILAGLDQPSAGEVFWGDVAIAPLSEAKRTKLRNRTLGFVYQFHHLLPEFTALENVCMPLLLGGQSPAVARALATEMLARVGLAARIKHKPGELSGGERQRVAIARALVHQPRCILADEPTGNLDERTAASVFDLLLELNAAAQTALIIVTHDLRIAARMQSTLHLQAGTLQVA